MSGCSAGLLCSLLWLAIRQANGTPIGTLNYYYTDASNFYHPTGHLQREVDGGGRTHAYLYDTVYQLREETHPDLGSVFYDFDLNGNRIDKTTNGTTEYYGVDANNRLLWVNQGTNAMPTSGQTNPYTLFTYDLNGRLTHRERKYSSTVSRTYDFFWDGDDRLRTVKQGSTSVLTANYDGGGLRTAKSDSWTGAHTYTWGPGGIVYDNNTGVTTTPGLSKRASGVDRFFHSDWLGSTRYLSDNTGNNFPSALRYDAFGGRSATGGADPYDPTDYQFGGQSGYQTEYASATEPGVGLQYLEQRYYDPAAGRFISPDPVGVSDYLYTGNDPVNGVDPSGLLSLEDIREFDYNNRFALGLVSGVGATLLTGNPLIGLAWGGYITYQNSVNGSGDAGMALADGFLVAAGVYELTGITG
jgi:RHS repeat-associated protein